MGSNFAYSQKMNLMKIFLLNFSVFCVCFFLQSIAFGQVQDVIYLHNGSILRGEVTELYVDSLVKLKTAGGNIFAIQAQDISYMTQEDKLPAAPVYFFRDSGFCHYSLWGIGAGKSEFDNLAAGLYFETLNGYQFSRKWQFMLGTLIMASERNLLNVYADGRYHFFADKNTNFLYADAGLCTPLVFKNNFGITGIRPGLYLSPGYGLRINPKRGKLAFVFSFGYMFQQFSEIYEDEAAQTTTTQKFTQQRITIKLGFAY